MCNNIVTYMTSCPTLLSKSNKEKEKKRNNKRKRNNLSLLFATLILSTIYIEVGNFL